MLGKIYCDKNGLEKWKRWYMVVRPENWHPFKKHCGGKKPRDIGRFEEIEGKGLWYIYFMIKFKKKER